MVAMFIVALGFFTLIPMGNDYPSVEPAGEGQLLLGPCRAIHFLFTLTGLDAAGVINNSFAPLVENVSALVGCRYSQQKWCTSVPKIYLFQYVIALVLVAIGYPIASVLSYSIYSKILGPFKQVFTPTIIVVVM